MALSIALDGNLKIQLADEALPTNIPLAFNLTYNEKSMYDFSYATAQTNVAVPQGSVTAPKYCLIRVREGTVQFSWDVGGTYPWTLTANTVPPLDVPVLFFMRHAPASGQLYITTPALARGSIWLFE